MEKGRQKREIRNSCWKGQRKIKRAIDLVKFEILNGTKATKKGKALVTAAHYGHVVTQRVQRVLRDGGLAIQAADGVQLVQNYAPKKTTNGAKLRIDDKSQTRGGPIRRGNMATLWALYLSVLCSFVVLGYGVPVRLLCDGALFVSCAGLCRNNPLLSRATDNTHAHARHVPVVREFAQHCASFNLQACPQPDWAEWWKKALQRILTIVARCNVGGHKRPTVCAGAKGLKIFVARSLAP
jgi:hypothetical protein